MSATFTPAGSVAVQLFGYPSRFDMPALDASNPDTVIALMGGTTAWIRFGGQPGDIPLRGDPSTPGVIQIHAGQTILLTMTPAVHASAIV